MIIFPHFKGVFMKIAHKKLLAINVFTPILMILLFSLSCKDDLIVKPPKDKDTITVVDTTKSILSYFPINIGDVKFYKRSQNKNWFDVEHSQIKQIVEKDTTLVNGLNYSKNIMNFYYQDYAQNSIGASYYRIDTTSLIVYSYIQHKNKEEVFLPLNLEVGESFSLNEEENITLINFDTVNVLSKHIGRKVFERRDIYGYTYRRYELLNEIGLFNYLYRGDIIGSVEDSLRGAIIDGEVIGDINDPSFPLPTRCDSLHNEFPNYFFVPCDYSTIQNAIDSSKSGDIIIVEEGFYKEEIDFKGKNLTIASFFFIDGDTSHISRTIIAGKDESVDKWTVKFISGETDRAGLIGFTIDCSRGNEFHYGGGIRCINSSPNLFYLIISNNALFASNGGGIFLENSDARIINSKIKQNENSRGGGIFAVNSSSVFDSVEFTKNKAEEGGAIYLDNSNVVISNTIFLNNKSDYEGGSIYCKKSDPLIQYSKFTSNTSTNGSPGIYFQNSRPILSNLFFSNSSGDFGTETGKSVINAVNSNIGANNILIVENKSSGIELDSTKLTIRNSSISKNVIGIYANNNSLLNMEKVTISNNKGYVYSRGMVISNSEFTIDSLRCVGNGPADDGIGGIGIIESTGSIKNSVVANNFCGGHGEGGGGFFIKNSNLDLKYVLISDNTAFEMNGSAIYSDGADISLKNVTLVNNSENLVNSGSIYNIGNSNINIVNSILWNNSPRNFYDTLGVTITYSNVEGGFLGEGNINTDPLFCSPGEKKYSLKPNSPCIGAGENGITIGSENVGCN